MIEDFIKELEELLHSTPYTAVDILPLVNKYTDSKNNSQTDDIHREICSLLTQMEDDKLIDKGTNYTFQLLTRTEGQYPQDQIIIRSKLKFEEQYKIKNAPPVAPVNQNFHFETHGHNSPIAGHNQEINEISVNKDDTESKSINKKSLNVNRWVLILTAVGIIVVIIVYLLQRGHTT